MGYATTRHEAYLLLADAGLLRKRRVNLEALASHLNVEHMRYPKHQGVRGGVQEAFHGEGNLLVISSNISDFEQRYELATLIASTRCIDWPQNEIVKAHKQRVHREEPTEFWQKSLELADFLVAFSFSRWELRERHGARAERHVAKLARRRKVPARIILRRLEQERTQRLRVTGNGFKTLAA